MKRTTTSALQVSALHVLAAIALALGILIGCSTQDAATVSGADGPDEAGDTSAAASSSTTTALTATTSVPDDLAPAGVLPVFHPTGNPESLSEWGQLASQDGQLVLSNGVTPYTLNSALFSDYALKLRTVWLPDGAEPAGYEPIESFDFPVGTVITKTFYYPLADEQSGSTLRVVKTGASGGDLTEPIDLATAHLVETRVLAHRESGWISLPYVWNDEQTEATLERAGDLVSLVLVDEELGTETPFPYVVPNSNQCAGCHATNHTTKLIVPIGPKARHLNTTVDLGDGPQPQLTLWEDLDLVGGVPDLAEVPKADVWDDDAVPLDLRARAYLDINCSHCHNSNGPADTSGLFLELSTEYGPRLGVCKGPVAAGTGTGNRRVGIHPGEPDDSIFVFRMESTDPGAMMPELGRSLTHREGVELISSWIDGLEGSCG